MAPRCFPLGLSGNEVCIFAHVMCVRGWLEMRERRRGPASRPSLHSLLQVKHLPQDLSCLLRVFVRRMNTELTSVNGAFVVPQWVLSSAWHPQEGGRCPKRPQVQRVTHFWLLSNTAFIALSEAGAGRFLLLCQWGVFWFSHLFV